jgi:hypothetical protein
MLGGGNFAVSDGKAESRLISGTKKLAHVYEHRLAERGLYLFAALSLTRALGNFQFYLC